MKKLICLALIFTMLLCGCSRWSVEIVDPTKPIENDSELVVSEDETEETEKTEEKEETETEEPGISESEGTKELTENDEPSVSDFTYIFDAEKDENLPLSEKQNELIEELLQTEKWTDLPENWQGKGGILSPSNIFGSEGKGTLYVSPDGDNTLIMLKWGENQKYQKYYYAPKEVAYDIEVFHEKIVFSKEIFENPPFTSEEFAEYQKKYLDGFFWSLPVWRSFDEENYFDDIYTYHLLSSAYYSYNGTYLDDDPESEDNIYPEEFVVDYIQKYFLWDEETIRKNAKEGGYDSESKTYNLYFGGGGGYYSPVISDVRQNGNVLEIDIEQYSAMDETYGTDFVLSRFNTLTIRLDDDGTWKYLGNKIYYVGE
ncbi:MAG: hypothetical protein IJO22_05260 [Oscillospiraceae bacterium]|nr:hypothetical protein [Oscillospiraceae bacterium]